VSRRAASTGSAAPPRPGLNRRRAGALLLGAAAGARSSALHAAAAATPGRAPVPWAANASIYEVNIRQFTPEGTLQAFETQLPRLQKLGVGILWLMPVQPIGVKHRKGTLGSYYSISDYTALNPEFGSLAAFRRVVEQAHALGMRVILDWVANHTAWDHPWVAQHPDWMQKNAQGEVTGFTYAPEGGQVETWDDVVGLDYGARPLWDAMAQAMLFWLRETGIDGFRCDVASLVPTPFWDWLRPQLDAVKPVFMLAESDKPELHASAFDMGYDWKLFDTLKGIAKGRADAAELRKWWQHRQRKYPAHAIGMNFTANHDSNSWHGSDAEFYGSVPAFQAMAVLAATLPGMPLVYGGQEAWFQKRLAFFEKDAIDWGDLRLAPFYSRLLALKRRHPALAWNAPLRFEDTGNDAVLSFSRHAPGQAGGRVSVTVNLSGRPQVFGGTRRQTLAPWAWRVVPG
jgi:glycosidase